MIAHCTTLEFHGIFPFVILNMARGATQRRGEKRDHSATLGRSTMTGEYPALLRRPARVGAQYQTKVPSSSDLLLRPSPQLMSKEFPYAFVKQDEVAISLSQPANRKLLSFCRR